MDNIWQPGISLDEVERHTILGALKFYQGNRTKTADALKIAIRTLSNKIVRYKAEGFDVTPAPNTPGAKTDEEIAAQPKEKKA